MRHFAERFPVRRFVGSPLMLETLLTAYREFAGARAAAKPSIAIVDLKGLPTQKEFELFREFFESRGYPSAICSPDELEFKGGRLRSGEFEIDIIYKRLL